jgi:hypothetical protein
MDAIAEAFRPLTSDVFGGSVVLIRDEEDFREHGIRKERYLRHTGGTLPLLYVGVVYIPDQFDLRRVEPVVERFGLTFLDEIELERPGEPD